MTLRRGLSTAARASAGAGSGAGAGNFASVRVVTYNVLSAHLCSPTSYAFRLRNPEDLKAEVRYARLEKRLEEEVQRGSVVCLQEVCTSWGGRLLGFFARNQYMFVHTNYSGDRMGVGIAYPLGAFQLLEADLPRIAGTKQWPPQPRPSTVRALLDFALAVPVGAWTGATGRLRAKTPKAIKSAVSSVVGTVSGVIARVCARRQVSGAPWGGDPSADVWQAAQRRQNRAAMLRLQHIATGVEFVVGTYHMPCAFRTPAMMVIHAALVGQKVTSFANGCPAVLAGDFNFKPHAGEACYQVMTTGKLEANHPDYPTPPDNEAWRPVLKQPWVSAYAAASEDGKTEPPFTNYVVMSEEEEFCDCIDYVFVSPEVQTVAVDALPATREDCGPMPNARQPSDHLALGANLMVPKVAKASAGHGSKL